MEMGMHTFIHFLVIVKFDAIAARCFGARFSNWNGNNIMREQETTRITLPSAFIDFLRSKGLTVRDLNGDRETIDHLKKEWRKAHHSQTWVQTKRKDDFMDTWTHEYVSTRQANNWWLTVRAGLVKHPANKKPYFSVTASGYLHGSRVGGCLHDEILILWPELEPVIKLHLSDSDGIPLHAEANARYWLSGIVDLGARYRPEQTSEECRVILRNHLRISDDELQILIGDPSGLREWCNKILPQSWKNEADQAIVLLDKLGKENP